MSGLLSGQGRQGTSDITVKQYGAVGDGVTNDRVAVLAAMTAAAAAGRPLIFPAGTYSLGRDGSQSYCIDVPVSDLTLIGEPGAVITQPSGMPDASVSIFRVDTKSNIVFRDLVFDGNWGNTVTEIAETSHRVALPQGTIYVKRHERFPFERLLQNRLENRRRDHHVWWQDRHHVH